MLEKIEAEHKETLSLLTAEYSDTHSSHERALRMKEEKIEIL